MQMSELSPLFFILADTSHDNEALWLSQGEN
jgi:hypothetical protein